MYEFDGNKWTPKSKTPFDIYFSTSGSVSFGLNNKGYALLTDSQVSGVVTRSFWEYDPVTDQWTQLPDFPGTARRLGWAFTANNKAYYGAGDNSSIQPLDDLWEFDGMTKKWIQKRGGVLSGSILRSANFSASVNGKIYVYVPVVGGGGRFFEYNPVGDSWLIRKGSGLVGVDRLIANNGKLFGIISSSNGHSLTEYNPITDSFSSVSSVPNNRRYPGVAFVINNKIYVGLGETYSGIKCKDIWMLNN